MSAAASNPLKSFRLLFRDRNMERSFRREFARRTLRHNRIGIYLSMVAWLLAGIEVQIIDPQSYNRYLFYASLLLPSFALTLVFSYSRRRWRLTQFFAVYSNVSAAVMVLYLFGRKIPDPLLLMIAFVLVQFFSPFILRIRAGISVYVTLAYTILASVLIAFSGLFDSFDAQTDSVIIIGLLIGWTISNFGAHFQERSEREVFILRKQLEEMNQDLTMDSRMDALTGLYNRRRLFDVVAGELESESLAVHDACVAILDIDHFKKVNDDLGHPVGDSVLKEFALLMQSGVRQTDLCARYGGEEFVILYRLANVQNSGNSLQRLLDRTGSHRFTDVPWTITFSAGIVPLRAGETVESALQAADDLLLEAKRAGRNRILGTDDGREVPQDRIIPE